MVIQCIEEIKKQFHNRDIRESETLIKISNLLKSHPVLRNASAVQSLLQDLETNHYSLKRLHSLKNHINQQTDNTVVSCFYANYFPSLSIDAFQYEELPPPEELKHRMNSPVLAVRILEATTGFHKKNVVALFPENHIDGIQVTGDKIFYFIDKFSERFNRITRKLLPLVHYPGIDQLAQFDDIESLSVYWVWLHEHFHKQGDMPIPEFLAYKTLKPLAGLEELRVDIAGMRHCLQSGWIEPEKAKMIATFILSERLLRYAVEGSQKPNYDAIASQILFQYLLHEGVITIGKDKQLTWHPDIFEAIFAFFHAISDIEARIKEQGPERVQSDLLRFACQYKKDKTDFLNFEHSEYFTWVKQTYQV